MKTNVAQFHRQERLTAVVGAIALLLGALLASRFPGTLAPAWRCATLVCVGTMLGSVIFALIHQLTGGEWGASLRPFLLSGTRLLPWTWLLVLPLLGDGTRETVAGPWWTYASLTGYALRAGLYGVVFVLVSIAIRRAWPRETVRVVDAEHTPPFGHPSREGISVAQIGGRAKSLGWVGPAGAIVIIFMNHFLVSDWLAALDPRWHSTAFPLVWLIGQAVAGLAVAIGVALLAGVDPAKSLGYRRSLGIDWGTLLFAAAMLWCYVTFAQFLIVWSGNLPEEAGWFTRRLSGGWRFVPPELVALHFLAPLLVLLSRRAKQDRRFLLTVAGLLLIAQCLHTAWVILPAFPLAPAAMPWIALLLTVGLGGVFANRYLAGARKERDA